MPVKNNLFQYWKQKELERGGPITVNEISKATGLHRETVSNLLHGKTNRYDAPVLEKICEFFNVPPGPIPFIVYDPT